MQFFIGFRILHKQGMNMLFDSILLFDSSDTSCGFQNLKSLCCWFRDPKITASKDFIGIFLTLGYCVYFILFFTIYDLWIRLLTTLHTIGKQEVKRLAFLGTSGEKRTTFSSLLSLFLELPFSFSFMNFLKSCFLLLA